MTEGSCRTIFGFGYAGHLRLEASVRHGKHCRDIGVTLNIAQLKRLAAIVAHTEDAGHIAWHYHHADAPLPCERCSKGRAQ